MLQRHIHAIHTNKTTSRYVQHVLETGHTHGTLENALNILHHEKKGPLMNTLEQFHIHRLKKDIFNCWVLHPVACVSTNTLIKTTVRVQFTRTHIHIIHDQHPQRKTTTHTSNQTRRAKTNKYIIGTTIHVAKSFTT
jgi:hypothetical protein